MKTGILLIVICSIITSACCSTANCSRDALSFPIEFISEEKDYYYFTEPEKVDIKAFYGDSTFINVSKQIFRSADSTQLSFFLDISLLEDEYTILANDTLLGKLKLVFKEQESTCCGSEYSLYDYDFESKQQFFTNDGLQIIL
tara:strand:+ start:233 stop:661 length:429 start_codon:yes stop_codon:yes gene_type:complete